MAFQGAETDVLALATSSLWEEVLLSWRALQRLGIISKDLPNRISKVKTVSATPQERLQRLTLLGSVGGGHDGPMFRRSAAVLARIEIMSFPLVTF